MVDDPGPGQFPRVKRVPAKGPRKHLAGSLRRDPEQELDELRGLLGGVDPARVEALEQRAVDPEDVADVLPEAILRREMQDDRVARALAPTIEAGLFRSARSDPQTLADAIHPALGPAIRSMIQASLRQSLESLNVALENALSPQGLSWRLEAARTGKSFSEVVLLKTLLYRVEQVLLVDRDTGLVMAEAHAPDAPTRDADMVAGMLSAIRDFASDSFGTNPDEGLEEIEFAGLTLILDQGPSAVLALVVRGNPPRDLHERANEACESLHVEFARELAAFDGDEQALAGATPVLEDLLRSEVKARKPNRLVRLLPILAAVAVAALIGWRTLGSIRANGDLTRVRSAFERTPGLVVTDASLEDGVVVIEGLVDPLVRDPASIAAVAIRPSDRAVALRLRPFASLADEVVVERARRSLALGPTVDANIEAGNLVLTGLDPESPEAAELRVRGPLLPGVDRVTIVP